MVGCSAPSRSHIIYFGLDSFWWRIDKQAKKFARGRVTNAGRISLPAEFRRAVGLEHGGDVVLELDGNEIRICTIREAVARAQALSRRLLAGKPALSVDDFLAHRREDWGEE